MKLKIIILIFLALGIFSPSSVFAQKRTLPQNEPLQPANQPVIIDFSQNVNTEGSPYHQDTTPPPVTDDQILAPDGSTPSDAEAPSPVESSAEVEQKATFNYWILLFVGLAGLMIAVVWGYLRFVR